MSDNGHCTVQIKSLYVKTFPISFNPDARGSFSLIRPHHAAYIQYTRVRMRVCICKKN